MSKDDKSILHVDAQNTIRGEEPNVVIKGTKSSINNDGPPIDRYNLIFIVLFIHGVGTLMPWNMFITAESYFRSYKIVAHEGVEPLEAREISEWSKNFMVYLGLASQIPNLFFNALNLVVNVGSGNLKIRVNLMLILEALVFSLTIGLAFVDSSSWTVTFCRLTLASVIVLNMASGIYQNCIFGTGAKFPGNYTNAILIGSNLSGVYTSVISLLAIWLAPEPQQAAMYYFSSALVVIIICIISYNLLSMNKFFRYYDQSASNESQLDRSMMGAQEMSTIRDEISESLRRKVEMMVPKPQEDEKTCMGELRKKWKVFLKCWPQCFNVFLTFYVTLALFPAVLVDIKQSQGYFSDQYFVPVACFFTFNLFALVGNFISRWTTWPGKNHVRLLVLARLVFIPIFLLCQFRTDHRIWPVYIKNDIVYMVANAVFAATSGYLSSLCMMFASGDLQGEEASTAGMLAAFFLVLGIFLGINSSIFFIMIV